MRSVLGATVNSVTLCFLAVVLSTAAVAQHYQQTNLVSNVSGLNAQVMDPNLQNAWGLVHSPTSPWWISNNAGGTSTVYNAAGLVAAPPTNIVISPLVVTVPNAPSQPPPGSPTGVMFNGSPTDFLLAAGQQANFIWATEDGTISGWNPAVKPTTAVIMVNNSQSPNATNGAVYKGATIADVNNHKFILAANFRSGKIDVFDTNFKPVTSSGQAFQDSQLPSGFAPFNVQGIGPNIYVTYAMQDSAKHDPVAGAGLGFVDVFSPSGTLLARLQSGQFNAPWGIVLAPSDFGEFSHTLLVGNFGDGTIGAYNPITGQFIAKVLDTNGNTLAIDGLWALAFGNGGSSGPGNTLFFTAGPNSEKNGLFGTLTPIAAELSENDEQ